MIFRFIRKSFWTFIMIIAFPIDYVGWNLIYGGTFGYRPLKQCVKDGLKQLEEYKRKIDKF